LNDSYIFDTNILLEKSEIFLNNRYKDKNIVIPIVVLEELDGLKVFGSEEIKYKVRETYRVLEKIKNIEYKIDSPIFELSDGWDKDKIDNLILRYCKDYDSVLVTLDKNMLEKAKALKLKYEYIQTNEIDDYTGWKIITLNDEELANFYQNKNYNWNLKINEYVILKNNNKIIDYKKYTKNGFEDVTKKRINSKLFGKFEYKDEFQICAVDSLFSNQMTLLKGKAGTGKSLIAISYMIYMIEKGDYDKIYIFVNTPATRNSVQLGFYPGTRFEKLMESQIGNFLINKIGDRSIVDKMVATEKLILLPFSDIRGIDLTNKNAIAYITEAQNLDRYLIKLVIQRLGNDSKLIIDGDYQNDQVDSKFFEGKNNGMRKTSQVFRGSKYYGEVELPIIYRSEIAKIAEKII
jgi:predicted ribonuclease YlaK